MSIISKLSKAIALIGLFSITLFAQQESTTIKIKSLQVMNDGRVIIWVTANTPCATDGYSININGTNGQQMYQAALSAYNTGVPVRIQVATTPCTWGTTITSLRLMEN